MRQTGLHQPVLVGDVILPASPVHQYAARSCTIEDVHKLHVAGHGQLGLPVVEHQHVLGEVEVVEDVVGVVVGRLSYNQRAEGTVRHLHARVRVVPVSARRVGSKLVAGCINVV